MSITLKLSASYSLPYTKNILSFTFSNLDFFDNETPLQKSPEYVNEECPQTKKAKKDYKDIARQQKNYRIKYMNEHNK